MTVSTNAAARAGLPDAKAASAARIWSGVTLARLSRARDPPPAEAVAWRSIEDSASSR